MAEHYTRCPGCGCDDDDLSVYCCENDHEYCSACAATASRTTLFDPLGLVASKQVCPRCHAEAGEITGKIRRYGLIAGTGGEVISAIRKFCHSSGNICHPLVTLSIAYLAMAGGALLVMEQVARFSLVWWLCGVVVVAGLPLYIILAYVTWYATLAVLVVWGLVQLAHQLMNLVR